MQERKYNLIRSEPCQHKNIVFGRRSPNGTVIQKRYKWYGDHKRYKRYKRYKQYKWYGNSKTVTTVQTVQMVRWFTNGDSQTVQAVQIHNDVFGNNASPMKAPSPSREALNVNWFWISGDFGIFGLQPEIFSTFHHQPAHIMVPR